MNKVPAEDTALTSGIAKATGVQFDFLDTIDIRSPTGDPLVDLSVGRAVG